MIALTWLCALVVILWGSELSVLWTKFVVWLNDEQTAPDPEPENVEAP